MIDNKIPHQLLIEISNYLNHKMEDKERYELERTLQKDPFLSDALDGISKIKTSEFERDIHNIKIGNERIKLNYKPFIWIALVLLIATIGYLITQIKFPERKSKKDQTEKELEKNLNFDSTYDVVDTFPVIQDTLIETTSESNRDSIIKIPVKIEPAKVKKQRIDTNLPKITSPLTPKAEIITITQPIAQPTTTTGDETSKQLSNTTPNASTIITNQDIVNSTSTPIQTETNSNPVPAGGEAAFKSYIDNNVNYPNEVDRKTNETVRLKFTVTESGAVSNFQLIKGPKDIAFTNEAIRVIKSGPKWAPAYKDGKPISKEVSIKVSFKP